MKPAQSYEITDALEDAGKHVEARVRVSSPGYVVSYDATQQRADIQIPIAGSRTREDGRSVITQLPVIPSVPVAFANGGGYYESFPIAAGDWVWVVFADRSIEEWLTGGEQQVFPQSTRMHHLTDAVAYPMVRPFADPLENVPTDRCRFGKPNPGPRIEVTDAGNIRIGNDTDELLDILKRLLTALKTAKTNTGIGIQPLLYTTGTFAVLAADLEASLANITE